MRKHKKQKKNNDVISISQLVSNIENHKELLLLVCSAISLVATAIWNVAIEVGVLGYACYWNIDYSYAPNDKQNFFVMFIITLCFSAIILYPMYQYAKWTVLHNRAFVWTAIVSIVIIISPFVLVLIKRIFENLNIYTVFLNILLILFMITVLFSMIFYPLYFDARATHKQATNEEQHSTQKTIKKSALLSTFVALLISVALLLVLVFFLGMSIAHRNEYSFLVDNNYDFHFENKGIYDVILSETDEYYYQAKCQVAIEEDNLKSLTVYCNQITICEKPEERFIIKEIFSEIKLDKGFLPIESDNKSS